MKDSTASWTQGVRSAIDHQRVFALVDPAVEARFGITDILSSLDSACSVTAFTNFAPNPCWDSLQAAALAADSTRVDCVLAVGGGTAIDLGKLTAMALQRGGIDELWKAAESGQELAGNRPDIRLVAVPTTAGTGAEATRFAVLYRNGIKYSVAGDALKPDASVLDPSFLTTLPPSVIADAGLDAACQAMESLWSVRSTPESEKHAWAGLDLAVEHLEPAVRSTDHASLAGMLVAAHLAGKAINLTTTTAPHALSYGLTSLLGVPHGRAVGLLFGAVFRLNAGITPDNCAHPKGHAFVQQRLGEIAGRWGQTRDGFPSWWANFLQDKLRIAPLSVKDRPAMTDQLMASVNTKRLANNPARLMSADIREVYQSII